MNAFLLLLVSVCAAVRVQEGTSQSWGEDSCTVDALNRCDLKEMETDGRCAHQNSLVACYQFLGCKQEVVDLQKDECMNGKDDSDQKCSESDCSAASALGGVPPAMLSLFAVLVALLL